MPHCLLCQFHFSVSHPQLVGESETFCGRYPPQVTSLPTQQSIATLQAFPRVNAEMCCGEFVMRREAANA
jgi:hypothetical protein